MSEGRQIQFKVRLPQNLHSKLTQESQQTDKSVNKLIIEAIEHWFKCDKAEGITTMCVILLRYPAKCKKCEKALEAGTWALYGRGVGAICLDCYIRRIGDKTLITKELKVRQLKWLKTSLEKEIDQLFSKYNQFSAYQEIDKTMKLIEETRDIIMKYLQQGVATAQEQTILEEVLKFMSDGKARLQEITDWLMRPKRKRRTKTYEL